MFSTRNLSVLKVHPQAIIYLLFCRVQSLSAKSKLKQQNTKIFLNARIQSPFTRNCRDENNLIILQESFVFVDSSRRLRHLKVSSCPRLVLPANAISFEARSLVSIVIEDIRHVEVKVGLVMTKTHKTWNMNSAFDADVDLDYPAGT